MNNKFTAEQYREMAFEITKADLSPAQRIRISNMLDMAAQMLRASDMREPVTDREGGEPWLTIEQIEYIRAVAKLAGVSTNSAAAVLLAVQVMRWNDAQPEESK